MSPTAHRIYISTLIAIVALVSAYLFYIGMSYYSTPLEERFYHPEHDWFKPSGAYGHGLGIAGTLLMFVGVFGYIARKRYKALFKLGRLKYWLEFHIFLCTLGPILVLFHTAFKFGGIVSISFWSMVAVVASGVIGRFIYIQIPRSIEGRELGLSELQEMKNDIGRMVRKSYGFEERDFQEIMQLAQPRNEKVNGSLMVRAVKKYFHDKQMMRQVKKLLNEKNMSRGNVKKVSKIIASELSLGNRIDRLQTMQKLFKYWHVAHLPFALIMVIILIVHVAVTLAFGYKWIF